MIFPLHILSLTFLTLFFLLLLGIQTAYRKEEEKICDSLEHHKTVVLVCDWPQLDQEAKTFGFELDSEDRGAAQFSVALDRTIDPQRCFNAKLG